MKTFSDHLTIAGLLGGAVLVLSATLVREARAQESDRDYRPKAEIESVVERIGGTGSVAMDVALVGRLRDLSRYVPQSWYRRQVETARDSAGDPRTAYRLQREVWRIRRELGGSGPTTEEVGSHGCLTRWSVVGPFDNNNMQAFRKRLAPEAGDDGPYTGKALEVDWRTLPDFDRGCVFRLGKTIRPSRSAVAYLAGEIAAESAREAILLMGVRGAYKVWVNGERVAEEQTNLGLQVDNQAWRVSLQKGDNRILVKLATRSSGTMDVTARLVDTDFSPIDVGGMEATWSGKAVEDPGASSGDEGSESGESEEVEATGDGIAALASTCAKENTGSKAAWCADLWSRVTSGRAASPWRDVADGLASPLLDSTTDANTALSPRGLVRVSGLLANPATELRGMKRARKLSPDDPWIGLALASALRSAPGEVDRRRAPKVVKEVRSNHDDFWPAELALASWYNSQGFDGRALEIVRDLEVDSPFRRPAIVQRLARLEAGAGTRRRARRMRKRLAAIRAAQGGWAWTRFDRLVKRGERDRALKLVRKQRRRHPLSTSWALKEADLLRAAGQSKEALTTLTSLISKKPGSVQLRRRKAELLVAEDRVQAAVSVLKQARKIEPQNQKLDEYLAELRTDRRQFYEPWMIEDVREYAKRFEPGSYSDDTVIDQTVVRVSPDGLSKRVVQRVDRAITSEGVGAAANLSVSYTRGDERVEVLDVRVYKSDGRVLEDYDQWRSGRSKKSGPYYSDLRYLNIQANNVEKGDLVEFRYRERQVANENFRGDYFGDISYIQGTEPVGFWRYAVEVPDSWDLYFRKPELTHETLGPKRPDGADLPSNYRVHGFQLEDVPPVKADSRQPGYADVYDYLLVSNKKTWDQVGEWWWNLIEEQLIVDDAIARAVETATDGLDSDRAKVEAIHNYVVENTRCLHVGLGIHGWKPYRTTQCFQNKYGDCKDKAALLKVMLEQVGIETNLVLVRTRDLGSVAKEPASMHVFNHAIVYVPSMDLYMDPTAEFTGVGQLPSMDYGAQGLIVRDGGDAELTTLPADSAQENLLVRELEVDLSADPAVTSGKIVAHGQNAVYYRKKLQNADRRDEIFEKALTDVFPGAQLVSATYRHLDQLQQPVEITFEFEGGRLERKSNDRSYVFPYGMAKDLRGRYAEQADRNQDLTIRTPISNETTMRFDPGEGRRFDRVPESVELDNEFGEFRVAYREDNGALVAETSYTIDTTRVPVEKYDAFRSFLSRATSALNETIAIVEDDGS